MKQHLNTLFVTTEGAYLASQGQAVAVRIDKQVRARVPLHNLGGIVSFGSVGCSPALMAACAEAGIALTFLNRAGRFLARVSGFTPGNVLLRREQYRRTDEPEEAAAIARCTVLAKVANSRTVLLRAARDRNDQVASATLRAAANRLAQTLDQIQATNDLDVLRGYEGEAAHTYFSVFNDMVNANNSGFEFHRRSRRPPRDRINALLSFLYAMITLDARSACEAAGLDPAVGYLHRDRPGRPGLALDLVEEFRAFLADRIALTLINRQQIKPGGFKIDECGAVRMGDDTRKTVLVAYQKRKQDEIEHPFLHEKTSIGLLIHLQARLLARYLRGELDAYPAFIARG